MIRSWQSWHIGSTYQLTGVSLAEKKRKTNLESRNLLFSCFVMPLSEKDFQESVEANKNTNRLTAS